MGENFLISRDLSGKFLTFMFMDIKIIPQSWLQEITFTKAMVMNRCHLAVINDNAINVVTFLLKYKYDPTHGHCHRKLFFPTQALQILIFLTDCCFH